MKRDDALEVFNSILREISGGDAPDLSPRQAALLVRICLSEKPVSVKDLAGASNTNRAAVVRGVDVLDAHGFVVRRRDPADRRNILFAPTSEGLAFLSAVSDRVSAIELARAGQDAV